MAGHPFVKAKGTTGSVNCGVPEMTTTSNGARAYIPPPSEVPWPVRRRERIVRPWMPFDAPPNTEYVRWVLKLLERLAGEPTYPMSHLMALYRKQRGRCIYCGHLVWPSMPQPYSNDIGLMLATLDHMTPLSRGGANKFSNLVAACYHCNNEKGSMDAVEYRQWRTWVAARDGAQLRSDDGASLDGQGMGTNGSALPEASRALHKAVSD